MEPGGFAIPHIDAGSPFRERWHIPVCPAGWFWQNGVYTEAPSEPFEVRHWEPHAVYNDSDKVRIHLLVDRKAEPFDAPKSSQLIITDMIPEVEALLPQ